jgi:hypothetical protein
MLELQKDGFSNIDDNIYEIADICFGKTSIKSL